MNRRKFVGGPKCKILSGPTTYEPHTLFLHESTPTAQRPSAPNFQLRLVFYASQCRCLVFQVEVHAYPTMRSHANMHMHMANYTQHMHPCATCHSNSLTLTSFFLNKQHTVGSCITQKRTQTGNGNGRGCWYAHDGDGAAGMYTIDKFNFRATGTVEHAEMRWLFMECSVLSSIGMYSYRPAYHHVITVVQH